MTKFSLLIGAMSLVFGLGFVSSASADVTVRGAKLDAAGKNLMVDISYGGGCTKPKIELETQGCAESMPVQCHATIKNMVFNACEMMISSTEVFNLKKYGIDGRYYSNGSLTIKGSDGSSATVRLPNFSGSGSAKPPAAAPVRTEKILCVTHTGSNLEINISEQEVTLAPVGKEAVVYAITETDRLLLERLPAIDQRTFSLDDGRKIVIETEFGGKVGTGYFIRNSGESSPNFQSCLITL